MKTKSKGSRLWSRILATQALYQISLNKNIDIKFVKKNLLKDKEIKKIPDTRFFNKLLNETMKNRKILNTNIEKIATKKKFSKFEILIKSILNLGACEILFFKDLSHKISIAEYNKVSSSFLNKNEVGLINSILDKLSKKNNNG